MTTLYRAAAVVKPYLGRGSYWTPSPEFARLFKHWLAESVGGEHRVYSAEVDLREAHALRGRLSSDVVTACVPLFADEGHQWLSFLERGTRDGLAPELAALVVTERQFVYLGEQPIAATRHGA